MEEQERSEYCFRSWQTHLGNNRSASKPPAEGVIEIPLLDVKSALKINPKKEVSFPWRDWNRPGFVSEAHIFRLEIHLCQVPLTVAHYTEHSVHAGT